MKIKRIYREIEIFDSSALRICSHISFFFNIEKKKKTIRIFSSTFPGWATQSRESFCGCSHICLAFQWRRPWIALPWKSCRLCSTLCAAWLKMSVKRCAFRTRGSASDNMLRRCRGAVHAQVFKSNMLRRTSALNAILFPDDCNVQPPMAIIYHCFKLVKLRSRCY